MRSGSERILLMFLKYPRPGKVKTRLAASLGAEPACALYRCFVADMLRACGGAAASLRLLCDPDAPLEQYAGWLGMRYPLMPQPEGGLGQRMQRSLCDTFAAGASQAVLIGSDIPELQGCRIDEAFAALARSDCVLGPAGDGGYYLIGFNRDGFCPEVFEGCDWGAPTVFEATRRGLEGEGRTLSVLPVHDDIDTVEDLTRYLIRNAPGPLRGSHTYGYAERSGIAARLLSGR